MSQRAYHISIRIDEELAHLSLTPKDCCIFRVYDKLHRENKEAYEPEVLAIGPYYHGDIKLQGMEKQKMWYVQQLLERKNETSVDKYITALSDLEEGARKCYAESSSLDKDEFLKMILLDGLFMIELFRRYEVENLRDKTNPDHPCFEVQTNPDHQFFEVQNKNDPIFQFFRFQNEIRRDLLLLENQLPFFILVKLFDMTRNPNAQEDISHLAFSFMAATLPGPRISKVSKIPVVKHLLHLVHDTMCASFPKGASDGNKDDDLEFISSITELQEFGIELKRFEKSDSLFHIKFNNGLMEIPQLYIDDGSESFLRNLIAYEQFLPDSETRYVTDYTRFMDSLVNSSKDATLLRSCRIIDNCLGDDVVVCNMLNKLLNGVALSKNYSYTEVFDKVNKHCKCHWYKWMANLRRNYFNSPWAFISFVAAGLLLALTIAQTAFSAFPYLSPSSLLYAGRNNYM